MKLNPDDYDERNKYRPLMKMQPTRKESNEHISLVKRAEVYFGWSLSSSKLDDYWLIYSWYYLFLAAEAGEI